MNVKFRAWDKIDKKMVSVERIDFHMGEPRIVNDFSVARFELMQFTGLTDEKGRDIYEGDVLRHEFFVKPEFSFEYSDKKVEIFEVKIPDFFEEIGQLTNEQPPSERGKSPSQFMLIIGNVHEKQGLSRIVSAEKSNEPT